MRRSPHALLSHPSHAASNQTATTAGCQFKLCFTIWVKVLFFFFFFVLEWNIQSNLKGTFKKIWVHGQQVLCVFSLLVNQNHTFIRARLTQDLVEIQYISRYFFLSDTWNINRSLTMQFKNNPGLLFQQVVDYLFMLCPSLLRSADCFCSVAR